MTATATDAPRIDTLDRIQLFRWKNALTLYDLRTSTDDFYALAAMDRETFNGLLQLRGEVRDAYEAVVRG